MRPTAVVVDDDALARERLRDLVAEVPLVEIVGEAADGGAALEVVRRVKPDVVFLDIEMPGMGGLDVARNLPHPAAVIFTTAHNQYAVTAFELSAVDYLLKPFGPERFREAVERALAYGTKESPEARARRYGEAVQAESNLTRLFLRERDAIVPVAIDQVVRFEADGDYVKVHTHDRSHLVRLRIQDLESRLGERFLRVHRSHLVNMDHVQRFENQEDARLVVLMSDGTRVVASRSRSRELRRIAR